ncbi:MAG: Eco57I restriction-modification methylase domain-containing protein [Promethearchaeota archaeon]
MDAKIICGQIYEMALELIKKHPDPLVKKWFRRKNSEFLSRFGLSISEKKGHNKFSINENISNLRWYCNLDRFLNDIGDLLNKIVNQRGETQRSNLGQEFTPFYIVHQMIDKIKILNSDKILNKKNSIVLDFAGGTGNFIISILQEELTKFESIINFSNSKYNIQDLIKKEFMTLAEKLYAIDIDPISCYSSQIFSILIVLHFLLKNKVVLNEDILNSLPLITTLQENFIKLHKIHPEFKADIILGNPPYIFYRNLEPELKKKLKNETFVSVTGQYDLSDVFIEQSLKILKPEGILSVIIPETLLFLENKRILRRIIVQYSQEIIIIPTDNVFEGVSVENILLFCRKNKSSKNDSIKISWKNISSEKCMKKDVLERKNVSLINYDTVTQKILNFINKNYLSINEWNRLNPNDKIEVFRGVELSKNGKIMKCNHCSNWMPFSEKRTSCIHCKEKLIGNKEVIHIISEKRKSNSKTVADFIRNITLNKFYIEATSNIKLNFPGINYKELSKYRKKRIIVRQILSKNKICAAISPENTLTSQSIYNIILAKNLESHMVELTHILRTDIISYYNYITFGRGKRLFPRILLSKLKDLPWIPRNLQFINPLHVPKEFTNEIERIFPK